ncbi:PAS domain S-box protein [Algoriphagus sanaruensis]|uniref:PAS domain-containing protein n=1 Tax=Algoriphagus sanaruensis TaxID=1727163 RepID=A0A142EI69_9BACT|nr:PAS domain S-box protein [Algoriphagus sanaruensis]AMQ54824.1 hypothetical protein AO498_00350 [Algoriphagus sanaruensis]
MSEDSIHKHILAELPVCILTLDKDFLVTYSNPSSRSVLGIESGEAIGKLFFDLIPEFEKIKIEFLYRNLSFVLAKHTNFHYSADFNYKINHTIFTNEQGISVILEKERYKYTPSKDESENKFKHLLDGLPGGILVVDRQYLKAAFSNRVFQQWLGVAEEEILRMTISELFEKQDRDLLSKELSKIAAVQRRKIGPLNLLAEDSTKIPVEITMVETEWNHRPCHCLFLTDYRNQAESDRIQAEYQKYEQIFNELAINFINIPTDQLMDSIEEALGIAGRLSNSDRAYTLILEKESNNLLLQFTWVEEGIPSFKEEIKFIPLDLLRPIQDELLKNKFISLTHTKEFPDNHPFKNLLTLFKIQDMVMVPIMDNQNLLGITGFAKVSKDIPYTESELIPIQIVSEIISNTLVKKATETLLKESEEENRKVFQNLSTGIIYQDRTGKIIKANPSSLHLLGLSFEEIQHGVIQNPSWQAFSVNGEKINSLQQVSQRCFDTGLPIVKEIITITRPYSTRPIWLSVDAIPEFLPDQVQAHRVFISLNDITERIEAESNLEKNIKLLEAIVENSHSAIFVKDTDSRYIMVNRRWEIVTGFSREEVIGRKLEEYLDPKLAEKYTRNDEDILIHGKTTFTEESLEQAETNGIKSQIQYFLSIKFPYRNGKGEIIGMCGIATDITAVKEASLMVEEREANLNGILESVSENIWSVDKDLNILFTNQLFFNEFFRSYGVELLKGQNILTSIPVPSERKKWEKRYHEVMASRKTLQFNDVIPTPQKTYYLEVVMYPIVINDQLEGISVFSKDITEKIALEESSALYSSLFESATNEIYLISTDTKTIQKANKAALLNTGYSWEEIQNFSIDHLINTEDQQNISTALNKVIEEKNATEFIEFNILRKDRTTYAAEALIQHFHYEGKDFISAFVTDISERKKTQLALRESELRFSQIFKENVTPMLLIDPHTGNVEDANPSASTYYGYDIDTFKTKNLLDVNYTFVQSPEEMMEATKQVIGTGKGKFLFNHKLKSGEIRSVEVFCSKITINNKELVHEIIQDVTDRTNYFNALVKQNEALKEIAWIQSHIVRAPLAKIMGLVQLLQEEKEGDDYSFEFILQAILNASKELDKVILDISEKSNDAKHLFE